MIEASVVIPTFNRAEGLRTCLETLSAQTAPADSFEVVVVDDGSRDGTGDVAEAHGAVVARHVINRGGGAALRTGYRLLADSGARIVVTLDADGQHDPAEIDRLVGPIVHDDADFVVGSRRKGESDSESRARDAGISAYTRLINLLGGTEISDVANGYRAIRASRLSEISFTEDQFHNPELLLGAARAGLRVLDVPVTIRRRASGESKKGTNLRYGVGFLRVMLKTWLR
jgi:glycosyltransferase involved in cell wall biosynthesis